MCIRDSTHTLPTALILVYLIHDHQLEKDLLDSEEYDGLREKKIEARTPRYTYIVLKKCSMIIEVVLTLTLYHTHSVSSLLPMAHPLTFVYTMQKISSSCYWLNVRYMYMYTHHTHNTLL